MHIVISWNLFIVLPLLLMKKKIALCKCILCFIFKAQKIETDEMIAISSDMYLYILLGTFFGCQSEIIIII